MIDVALFEPEIPPNTGNIARLCAATGSPLHLIGKLGFRLDERSLRRAGLDYWHAVDVRRHDSMAPFETQLGARRLFCFTTRTDRTYTAVAYRPDDVLLFGGETFGLPDEVLARHAENCVTIPMPAGKVRSLNLATSVGIALYEALRQTQSW